MMDSSSSPKSSHRVSPLAAKIMAAATGATTTALTMTPFDVIKTRLQTQPTASGSSSSALSTSTSHPHTTKLTPVNPVCCQPASAPGPCVRGFSSLALSAKYEPTMDFRSNLTSTQNVVCLWDKHGVPHSTRVTGFWDAASKVWSIEGAAGLWKGVGTTLVIAVPSQTAYMVTYDYLRNTLPIPTALSSFSPLIAGIIARSAVSSISSPLELMRTRLQATPSNPLVPNTFSSVLVGVKGMVRAQGLPSLWKGLGPTLWRDVPFSGVYWFGFETIKHRLNKEGYQGPGVAFLSGALSGTTAAILTSPFDVLKTRRQALQTIVSDKSIRRPPTSTIPLMRQIVRTEGSRALFAGLTPRMAKIAPACGIMIACYEGVEQFFDVRPVDEV